MSSKKNTVEELDLLTSLPSLEGYSAMDRYRDFRKVFLGTDEGKRVLREIFTWGRLFRAQTMGNPIDPHRMSIAFGERNIALKLLTTIHTEPKTQRTRKSNAE